MCGEGGGVGEKVCLSVYVCVSKEKSVFVCAYIKNVILQVKVCLCVCLCI